MMTLLHGDCLAILPTLPAGSVQTVITSPPYFGLRSYTDDPREIGKEPTPAAYVAALVAVFAEVWRVLRDDGCLWLNLGDSYAGSWGNYGTRDGKQRGERASAEWTRPAYDGDQGFKGKPSTARVQGIRDKNLLGMPWRVAFALQDAGWILRSDVIWSKPNCMPESVTDRPTRSHEYLFLFAKQARYYYDADAIREPSSPNTTARPETSRTVEGSRAGDYLRERGSGGHKGGNLGYNRPENGRNRRSVWHIPTQSYPGSHFATMPEALIEPCILAGSAAQACETCGAAWGRVVKREKENLRPHRNGQFPSESGAGHRNGLSATTLAHKIETKTLGFAPRCACAVNTGAARSLVLDPFGGSGTVSKVAERYQRDSILIDLNADYIDLQEQRTNGVQIEMQL